MADPGGRARAWVAHLRQGGTTPWSGWQGTGPVEDGTGTSLPGAQQLELLRRVNETARRRGATLPAGTADRVLAAAAAGRGLADLPLVGADVSPFGPRPVDPTELTSHDLLRVASTLLAEDLVSVGAAQQRAPLARPWRRRHRLVGDPLVAAQVRSLLLARGRPEGGPRPHVVVAAGPFDELLVHTWTRRCFEHGTRSWPQWLRFWRERDHLPPRLDLADAVRRAAVAPAAVRVVTEPGRLGRPLRARDLPEPHVPGADQAELARRVAAVVGLLVPAEQRPGLMGSFLERVPATATPPVGVPARDRAWVESSAARVARDLRRAGYPVVGDLADLTPRFDRAWTADSAAELDDRVLELAVSMLVDPGWRRREGQDRA